METLFVNISSMSDFILFSITYATICILICAVCYTLFQILSSLLLHACKRLKLRWQNRRTNKRK